MTKSTASAVHAAATASPFTCISDISRRVSGVGRKTMVQAAGFLRVYNGTQPLDACGVHPESYDVATRIVAELLETSPHDAMETLKDMGVWMRTLAPRIFSVLPQRRATSARHTTQVPGPAGHSDR